MIPALKLAKGFTLIELIVVMILLGILSVTAYPVIFGKSGVSEHAYQARLIATLRAMQQRSMQDTRGVFCYQVNFTSGTNSSFGPPTLDFTDPANQALSCSTAIDQDLEYLTATEVDMENDGVSLVSPPTTVQFDSKGCPTGTSSCATSYRIELLGKESTFVCVEPHGYIHACT